MAAQCAGGTGTSLAPRLVPRLLCSPSPRSRHGRLGRSRDRRACAAIAMLTDAAGLLTIYGGAPLAVRSAYADLGGEQRSRRGAWGRESLTHACGPILPDRRVFLFPFTSSLDRQDTDLHGDLARCESEPVQGARQPGGLRARQRRHFRHDHAPTPPTGSGRGGRPRGPNPTRCSRVHRRADLMCAGWPLLHRPTTNDRPPEVESVQGQDILAQSFPAGAGVPPTDRAPDGDVEAVTEGDVEENDGIEAVSPPGPKATDGVGSGSHPRTAAPLIDRRAFDRSGRSRDAASVTWRERSGWSDGVEFTPRGAGWDSTVIRRSC